MSRARTAVKIAAASADRVRRLGPGLVVLIYHRVGQRAAIEVDLSRAAFADQIAFLAATGSVVTLDEGLTRLADADAPRVPMIAVTFDDGTTDFVDEALPVLVQHGVPATLYVATRFIDEGIAFPDDGAPLSWAALGDARASGLLDVGSHTHSHALLDRLPPSEVPHELDRSIALIEEHVGVTPRHFAYPKAVAGSREADLAVRARFASAAIAGTRSNRYGTTDPHRLARSPIQVSDGDRWFRHKVDGGMALEDTLRRFANRRRYADATT
ncbi:MAG TPA: polysaccharide deacetylase family protein [Acidimicrobiia bacterium]|nr:polysaccharide deacetylase family protein [Acidimicrobiia bacterium]